MMIGIGIEGGVVMIVIVHDKSRYLFQPQAGVHGAWGYLINGDVSKETPISKELHDCVLLLANFELRKKVVR